MLVSYKLVSYTKNVYYAVREEIFDSEILLVFPTATRSLDQSDLKIGASSPRLGKSA